MNTQLTNTQSKIVRLRVLGISGSLRRASYNTQALRLALRLAAKEGADVQEISLKELNLPMYDDDIIPGGVPASVRQIKEAIESSDLLLITSPEYNHSISGALKNAIDWVSRNKNSFDGKTAAIFGAATGMYGTIRGQFHLRQIMEALNVSMVPQPQVFIRNAQEAFNPDGTLRDQKTREQLELLIHKSIALAKALKD